MDLSFQAPGDYHFVRSVSAAGIWVADQCYAKSLLLSANQLVSDWPVQQFDELQVSHLETIFQLQPDLVLLGTGSKQRFPVAEFMMEFYQRGIGIEVMATAPACRTFNVLVAESRRVVAAFLPLAADSNP
ncbi:MAG: Mth938-like domain-containing protein [Xanthomonadales bacterium]|nr:Mth938-like domain-containing protein [Xanthomonadales bacterium]